MLAQVGAPSTAQWEHQEETGPPRSWEDHVERDAVRRPVRHEDLADDVLARHGAPAARVARFPTVVAHEEVVAPRHEPGTRLVVAPARLDVGLVQPRAVDEKETVRLLHG